MYGYSRSTQRHGPAFLSHLLRPCAPRRCTSDLMSFRLAPVSPVTSPINSPSAVCVFAPLPPSRALHSFHAQLHLSTSEVGVKWGNCQWFHS